jgi:hypothetical protein
MSTKEKIAVPLDGTPSIVLLSNGERMKRSAAKAQGWKIHGEPDTAQTPVAGEFSACPRRATESRQPSRS